MKPSIRATYDSRETGPRYHVTTRVNGRTIAFQAPVADPFVRQTVRLGIDDLLRALFRRRLVVEVIVGGDVEICNDVLELDENTLIAGRTRKQAFHSHINEALGRFVGGHDE
jgi:hypothetical protein